jgi:hypothetical protein
MKIQQQVRTIPRTAGALRQAACTSSLRMMAQTCGGILSAGKRRIASVFVIKHCVIKTLFLSTVI